MATVKVNKPDSIKEPCKNCKENEINVYDDDVPVYTDENGKLHVNKEYAKEFPEITKQLVEAEIEKNKNGRWRIPTIREIHSDQWWRQPYVTYTTSTGKPNSKFSETISNNKSAENSRKPKVVYVSKDEFNSHLGDIIDFIFDF